MTHAAIVETWRRLRDRLLETFPELADDPELLADVMDGLHGAQDIIASLIRKSREDEAAAAGTKAAADVYAAPLYARQKRLEHRSGAWRAAALELMDELAIPKIERPEFTASIAKGQQQLHIANENAIPHMYMRMNPTPNREAIKAALKRGEEVEGASLSNGSPVLRVNVR